MERHIQDALSYMQLSNAELDDLGGLPVYMLLFSSMDTRTRSIRLCLGKAELDL